jgi:nucleolar MIF4G domain-containing protein 1
VLATEPLRISLSDLLTADTRGKWWLIGAGWKGNPLVEIAEARAKQPQVKAETDKTDAATDEKALLALARKQGMNTDIRRSVFVVLMTSEVSRYGHSGRSLTYTSFRTMCMLVINCLIFV